MHVVSLLTRKGCETQMLFGFMIIAGLLVLPTGALLWLYWAISGKGKTLIGWRMFLAGFLMLLVGIIGLTFATPGG